MSEREGMTEKEGKGKETAKPKRKRNISGGLSGEKKEGINLASSVSVLFLSSTQFLIEFIAPGCSMITSPTPTPCANRLMFTVSTRRVPIVLLDNKTATAYSYQRYLSKTPLRCRLLPLVLVQRRQMNSSYLPLAQVLPFLRGCPAQRGPLQGDRWERQSQGPRYEILRAVSGPRRNSSGLSDKKGMRTKGTSDSTSRKYHYDEILLSPGSAASISIDRKVWISPAPSVSVSLSL
jgi:hypothetical protein